VPLVFKAEQVCKVLLEQRVTKVSPASVLEAPQAAKVTKDAKGFKVSPEQDFEVPLVFKAKQVCRAAGDSKASPA